MLGAILGDIIGSVYEFNNTKNYDFDPFTSESSVTDDSILTLAVASWLLNDPNHTSGQLEDALVRFGQEFPHPAGGYGYNFSCWLFSPSHLKSFNEDESSSSGASSPHQRHPYYSCGNGSAMRVSAVGWMFDSLEKTEEVAAISAAITHNHPEGIKGAQATAAAIYLARIGVGKKEIQAYLEKRFGYQLTFNREELHATYGWEDSCQGTVPPAIWAFLESTDFEDALRIAVSLGGDSDTLACITGGIAEAFYGTLPEAWVEKGLNLLPASLKLVLRRFRDTYYQPYYDAYIQSRI